MESSEQKYTHDTAIAVERYIGGFIRSESVKRSLQRHGYTVDDLLQETHLKFVRHVQRNGVSAEQVHRSARVTAGHCFTDLMKSSKRRTQRTLPLECDVPVEPRQSVSILSLIGSLSPADQTIILAKYLEGLSNEQIAERLGISKATVFRRLQAALSELRAGFW